MMDNAAIFRRLLRSQLPSNLTVLNVGITVSDERGVLRSLKHTGFTIGLDNEVLYAVIPGPQICRQRMLVMSCGVFAR